MIVIICAMPQERDALLQKMSDIKIRKAPKINYHGGILDNEYYEGTIGDKKIVISRCGVGEIYASMITTKLIARYRPELVINLGVAGSLNEKIHVNDIVVATKAAQWRMDIPEKDYSRSFSNPFISADCDEKVIRIVKKIKGKTSINCGPIVSADEFIYNQRQVRMIKKYFPEALCGEMEGAAIATVCYAHNIPCSIIRSISDETLIKGDYKYADFNLDKTCATAAEICVQIIKRY